VEVGSWTKYLGYPRTPNVAIGEVYQGGLIQNMFASVFTGTMTPEEALTQADQEVRKIYDKWRSEGKI